MGVDSVIIALSLLFHFNIKNNITGVSFKENLLKQILFTKMVPPKFAVVKEILPGFHIFENSVPINYALCRAFEQEEVRNELVPTMRLLHHFPILI